MNEQSNSDQTAGQEQMMQQMQEQQGVYQKEIFDDMFNIQQQLNQLHENRQNMTGQNQSSGRNDPAIVCVVE